MNLRILFRSTAFWSNRTKAVTLPHRLSWPLLRFPLYSRFFFPATACVGLPCVWCSIFASQTVSPESVVVTWAKTMLWQVCNQVIYMRCDRGRLPAGLQGATSRAKTFALPRNRLLTASTNTICKKKPIIFTVEYMHKIILKARS